VDKAKVYTRIGRGLLLAWVMVWVILICKPSMPYAGFNALMLNVFSATVINFAFNPCAFIGAILLDLVAMNKAPLRKRAWLRLVILYLIVWTGLFIIVLRGGSMDRPINYGGGLRMIEKPLAGERK
jgi:hypothetical protein